MFLIGLASWSTGPNIFSGGRPIEPLQAAISLGLAVSIIAVAVTVFAAVPTVILLNRRRWVSLGSLLLVGAALGNLPFALIVSVLTGKHLANGTMSSEVGSLWFGVPGAARSIALGLVCGITCALVFWTVAIRGTERRPTTAHENQGS
jgi:hypothetical protein